MLSPIAIDLDGPSVVDFATPPRPPDMPLRRWGRALAPSRPAATELVKTEHVEGDGAEMESNSSLSGWKAAAQLAERRRGPEGKPFSVQGDDCVSGARLDAARGQWRQTLEGCEERSQAFEDAEFPADSRSLFGRGEAEKTTEASADNTDKPPSCRCGSAAKQSQVKKEGPTKGRPYWHCESRRCGFFAWADAESRRTSSMWWQRFPEFCIVSDFGFRAEDLRQGGIGDCWFMSALAVVAERPDLILRIFGGETAKNVAGCYQLQLFLDGEWQAVTIDDRLPCTCQQRRPDGSGLAYSRADGQQLWTALLEKAYAKAHGSYKAISGGEIAEALLDLTGCPTESIDFDEAGFDPQELWERLMSFKAEALPMGCATAGNPELKEVGLCGNHAYSILDIREIHGAQFAGKPAGYGGAQQDGSVRLLRIRNPHGVGEWSGEWSDKSAEWTDQLALELGRTGVDDGTFWIDYTHFLMAFQVVDVCMAYRGWHARSFETAFCAKSSACRLCKHVFEFSVDAPTTIYAMALQPTKRGAWCRDDRKRSYKPGDVTLLVVRLRPDRTLDAVVGGNFFCADIMARRCVRAELGERGCTYALLALCFGTGPVAPGGEQRTREAPFRLRLFSSRPLVVRALEVEHVPHLATLAAPVVHAACLSLAPAPGRRFRRKIRSLSADVQLFQVCGEGATLLLAANGSSADVRIAVRADVKVMTARAGEGLLTAAAQPADEKKPVVCFKCQQPGHLAAQCPVRGIRQPWRYPAKFRRVSTTCCVSPGTQRLVVALVGNGMQADLADIEVEVVSEPANSKLQRSGRQSQLVPRADLFGPQPLNHELVKSACKQTVSRGTYCVAPRFDDVIEATKRLSDDLLQADEQRQLENALLASVGQSSDEQQQLENALRASVGELCILPQVPTVPFLAHFAGRREVEEEEERLLSQAMADSLRTRPSSVHADEVVLDAELPAAVAAPFLRQVDTGCDDEELSAAIAASVAACPPKMSVKDADLDLALLLSSTPSQQRQGAQSSEGIIGLTATNSIGVVDLDDSDLDVGGDDLVISRQGTPDAFPRCKRPKVEEVVSRFSQ